MYSLCLLDLLQIHKSDVDKIQNFERTHGKEGKKKKEAGKCPVRSDKLFQLKQEETKEIEDRPSQYQLSNQKLCCQIGKAAL